MSKNRACHAGQNGVEKTKSAPAPVVRRKKRGCASLNAPVVHPHCNLESRRIEMGFTQPLMAKKCGISASCLWKYEQGVGVKLTTARRIAKAMVGRSDGTGIDQLWPE